MGKDLILYGAFDRYNYGDNLMPIVLRDYIDTQMPEVMASHKIVDASIAKSDLSRYGCNKSVSIRSLLSSAESGSGLVVVGGEVLSAKHGNLYLHRQSNRFAEAATKFIRAHSMRLAAAQAKVFYPSPWPLPYVPDPSAFRNRVNVVYNTVGGLPSRNLSPTEFDLVINTLNKSRFFSVRDIRTFADLSDKVPTQLSPDSVTLCSKLYDSATLLQRISERIKSLADCNYIVIQAAPAKAEGAVETLARQVRELAEVSKCKILLLPIGYASGHSDELLLAEVHALTTPVSTIVLDLNVWEIMYLLSQAKCYFGTSLHGAITALAYGVPHFGLNPKIGKLNAYVSTWSIPPFDKSIAFDEIVDSYLKTRRFDLSKIYAIAAQQHKLVEENNRLAIRAALDL